MNKITLELPSLKEKVNGIQGLSVYLNDKKIEGVEEVNYFMDGNKHIMLKLRIDELELKRADGEVVLTEMI